MNTTQSIDLISKVVQEHINNLVKRGDQASAELTAGACNAAMDVLKKATGYKEKPAAPEVVPALDKIVKGKKKE